MYLKSVRIPLQQNFNPRIQRADPVKMDLLSPTRLFVGLFGLLPAFPRLRQPPVRLIHGPIAPLNDRILLALGLQRGPGTRGALGTAKGDAPGRDGRGGRGAVDLAAQVQLEEVRRGVDLQKAIWWV